MEELIKLDSYPIRGLVRRLLQDKTTRKNIMFASDSYADYGAGYRDNSQMTEGVLLGFDSCDIQPRVYKAASEQTERTRKHAEVFTPAWIVNQMNNYCDAEWFGRPDVFNRQNGQSWEMNTEPILFPEGKDWKQYVDSRRLEITCGEAPYIVSRYDTSTGEIIPIERRIGILDRKLRVINENSVDEEEWLKWALRAFQSVYGYEYQGDNLLIARMNLLYTLADYIEARWQRQATLKELEKFLNVICWNIWQMDGMNDTPPYGITRDDNVQLSLFGYETTEDDEIIYCKIYDWRADISKQFKGLKKRGKGMKFDFVIGNPPYQDNTIGDNATYAPPIYHMFMEAAYSVCDKAELIHPARFLFNAGSTPKDWNKKMLNDEHFKVIFYEQDSSKVFKNTDIKGGVVVTYRDAAQVCGAIETFTPYLELNSILKKVTKHQDFASIMSIIYIQNRYDLEKLYEDIPECKSLVGSNGKDSRFEKNCFAKMPVFFKQDFSNTVKTIGVFENKRTWRFISAKYVDKKHENLNKYKVVMPVANGSGEFGQVLSSPFIAKPQEAYTRSFIGIGAFDELSSAEALLKYLKGKFARAMLCVLKVTQMNNKDVWAYVPLQDFTPDSDIDWSKPIALIDQQLYRKYSLTPDEIKFIETHVKEME
ncbi:MAG: Eco57I restriction-modification methylase domain-containing protein [Porcipelethomonas sp.]